MSWRTWIAAPVALAVVGIGITAGTASATDHTAPPNSKAFGKSLADWTSAYFVPGFSGSPIDTIKNVKLLPLPVGTPTGGGFTSTVSPTGEPTHLTPSMTSDAWASVRECPLG